jgi:hypothetical protein
MGKFAKGRGDDNNLVTWLFRIITRPSSLSMASAIRSGVKKCVFKARHRSEVVRIQAEKKLNKLLLGPIHLLDK